MIHVARLAKGAILLLAAAALYAAIRFAPYSALASLTLILVYVLGLIWEDLAGFGK
jgi:hypothetical protein